MVLNELWHWKPISEVSNSFKIDRGLVQNLSGMAAIEASCLLKFCEELESFWMFRELFRHLTQRLSNICITELMPLMELPCVRRVKEFCCEYKTLFLNAQNLIISGTCNATIHGWI